jgi:hypothetical protein
MQRATRSLLLTIVGLLLTGSVALAQSGSAGYYEFSTLVRFQRDVRVYGSAQVAGDLRSGGDVQAQRFRAEKQSTLSVTANSTVTPLGTFQPITATASVGTSSIAAGNPGDLLILVNLSPSNTVTFTDTGTLKLAGNAALGQNDTLTLISDGVSWYQMAKSDN